MEVLGRKGGKRKAVDSRLLGRTVVLDVYPLRNQKAKEEVMRVGSLNTGRNNVLYALEYIFSDSSPYFWNLKEY